MRESHGHNYCLLLVVVEAFFLLLLVLERQVILQGSMRCWHQGARSLDVAAVARVFESLVPYRRLSGPIGSDGGQSYLIVVAKRPRDHMLCTQ